MLYGRKQGSTAEPSAYYLFPRVRGGGALLGLGPGSLCGCGTSVGRSGTGRRSRKGTT